MNPEGNPRKCCPLLRTQEKGVVIREVVRDKRDKAPSQAIGKQKKPDTKGPTAS